MILLCILDTCHVVCITLYIPHDIYLELLLPAILSLLHCSYQHFSHFVFTFDIPSTYIN